MTFRFTISDLGIFLNKSPVTIRAWERKGLLKLPRVGNSRALGADDLRQVARVAYMKGRISLDRRNLIAEAATLLEILEQEDV